MRILSLKAQLTGISCPQAAAQVEVVKVDRIILKNPCPVAHAAITRRVLQMTRNGRNREYRSSFR